MKLRILMPIKYKSTPKELVSAKLKQYYGSKIVHLFQDNDTTESSPKAIKDAKTWELPGAPLLWPPPETLRQAPGRTPPVTARATHLVGDTLTSSLGRHIQ